MTDTALHQRLHRRATSIALVALLVFSLVAAAFTWNGTVRAAQTSSMNDTTAALTPASSVAYIDVNLDQTSEQWKLATSLFSRAGLDDVLQSEGGSSTDMASVEPYLGGSAALVLSKLPATGDLSLDSLTSDVTEATTDPTALTQGSVPSGYAVIFQNPDPTAAETAIKQMLDDTASANGSTVETKTYEGVTISYVTPADSSTAGTAYAVVKNSLVLATVPDDIEPIVDASRGKSPVLADDATYKTLKSDLHADTLAFGVVNGSALVAQAKAEDPSTYAEIDPAALAQFDATVGFVFYADQPGFRIDTLSLPGKDAATPAAQEPVSGDFASKVPADSLFFANGNNINQFGILDTLGLIFAQALVGTDTSGGATPAAATPVSPTEQAAQIYEQAAQFLGFNIKTDFIDQLKGEFGFAVSVSDITAPTPNVSAIFASDVDNGTKVRDVASKISFILSAIVGSNGLSSRDIGSDSVTTIDVNALSGTPEASTPVADSSDATNPLKIEYGVVGDQLLIGVNDGIDTYVNGPKSSLADSQAYKDTLAQLPKDPTGIAYVNVKELLPLLEESSASVATSISLGTPDANPDCAKYSSQKEAQDAYDADSFTNFDLDEDGDGQACEDFFAAATPAASPVSIADSVNVESIGSVTYEKDGNQASSTIILIGQ